MKHAWILAMLVMLAGCDQSKWIEFCRSGCKDRGKVLQAVKIQDGGLTCTCGEKLEGGKE